jgi:alkyldihydroxyacetonephosphate synthase
MTEPTPVDPLAGDHGERFGGHRVGLDGALLEALAATGAGVSTDHDELLASSRDWWPLGIGWAAQGRVGALGAAIVTPSTSTQVAAVVAACAAAGVPVTPAGGRSGVNGGTIPIAGGVILDLTGLDEVLAVDETSLTVHVEAGVFGPDLERHLRSVGPGYTLGHWPQSMDLSTVGGWLACRGAGQYSTRYGKIEDMVRGLDVVLPDGTAISTEGTGPRAATGPNLSQLFVGAEGTLGVITAATLAIRPIPAAEQRLAVGFDSFGEGLDACRRILRRGATPAVLRLYDEIESARNFDVATCALIVLDEADPVLVEATMAIVAEEVTGATALERDLVERWLSHRNDVSSLAPLWQAKYVVETIEMAGPWAALPGVCEAVLGALREIEGTIVASVHQSHAYSDGACLYFTFVGKVSDYDKDEPYGDLDAEEAYYRRCWDAATAAIDAAGCAISHHHGIGLNRARFMPDALGSAFTLLERLKGALDPSGIMNPGKLGLGEGSPW